MSPLGQKRRFDAPPTTSGLSQSTDMIRPAQLVRKVPMANIGVIIVRQLFDPARPGSGRRFKRNAEHLGGFDIDDHLGVRNLLLFNDGAPEACRSFAS